MEFADVWNHRNKVLAGGKKQDPGELVEWAVSFFEDYKGANRGPCPERTSTPGGPWLPPKEGFSFALMPPLTTRLPGLGWAAWLMAIEGTSSLRRSPREAAGSPPLLAEATALLPGGRLALSIGARMVAL